MITGGCYCQKVRYESSADPVFRAQCHCRECQYYSGGHPNVIVSFPIGAFRYTCGEAAAFTRQDLGERAVTREFCSDCGTSILTRSPRSPQVVIVKVGALDDPALFGAPQIALQTADKQSFHHIPDGVPAFERRPG